MYCTGKEIIVILLKSYAKFKDFLGNDLYKQMSVLGAKDNMTIYEGA